MVNLYPAAVGSDDEVETDESGVDEDMEDVEVRIRSSIQKLYWFIL